MSIPRQRRRVFRWDYDKEKLQKAIEVVVAGVMTSRQAAEVYGVPRSTVYKAAVKQMNTSQMNASQMTTSQMNTSLMITENQSRQVQNTSLMMTEDQSRHVQFK
jgi:transposase